MTEKFYEILAWLKKTYLIWIFGIVLGLFCVVFLVLTRRQNSSLTLTPKPASSSPTPTTVVIPTLQAPKTDFQSLELATPLPLLPQNFTVYTLKTGYRVEDVQKLAKLLGLSQLETKYPPYIVAYEKESENNRGLLIFNAKTGEFTYQSYGIHKPKDTSDVGSLLDTPGVRNQESGKDTSDVGSLKNTPGVTGTGSPGVEESGTAVAQQFLTDLGLSDRTISCPITYQRKDRPGITFVECHRDWNKVGLPILNAVGILSIPESQSLSSVVAGQTFANSSSDPSITNVSFSPSSSPQPTTYNPSISLRASLQPTTFQGKARPNDFNTITVGLNPTGNLLSIESNLRRIVRSDIQTPILSPEQAFIAFQNHQETFSLALPSGEGLPDFQKIFPGGLAQAPKAIVTDYMLAYLEKPPSVIQGDFIPMYLIRGTAELSSGYRAKFIQAIPAVALYQTNRGTVEAVSTTFDQETSGLKFRSFEPTTPPVGTGITPTSLPTDILSYPTSSTTNPPQLTPPTTPTCNPTTTMLTSRFTFQGQDMGYFGGKVYLVPKQSGNLGSLDEIQQFLLSLQIILMQMKLPDYNIPHPGNVLFKLSGSTQCPVQVSGQSPTLFAYGPPETTITIRPRFALTYTDSSRQNNKWTIKTAPEGIQEINNAQRSFLYYEHPLTFTQPSRGWIMAKDTLEKELVDKIAAPLHLTEAESHRLFFEIHQSALPLTSPYLFVGFIDQEDIDRILPLEITPKDTKVYRYLFYVARRAMLEKVPEPTLSPIDRAQPMIVELGSFSAE